MAVEYFKDTRTFRLRSKDTDWVMQVVDDGYLLQVYCGAAVPDSDLSWLLRLDEPPFVPSVNIRDKGTFMDSAPFVYPCAGTGDYREPAFEIVAPDGTTASDLRYSSHRIYSGKPALDGLPATFATEESGCETLEIVLEDKFTGLEVTLVCTAFEKLSAFTRSVRVKNCGLQPVYLKNVSSLCVDFDSSHMDMMTLWGSWARERIPERCRLHHGVQYISSGRGTSSHQYNPFAALCARNADEDSGEVWGFSLVYSGNFKALAEVTQHDCTRFIIGMGSDGFLWKLEPGETFTAPEAAAVHSLEGLGGMSRTFHDLWRQNLIRSPYKFRERPVLINNWEATYFNFDADKLADIAREASQLGIEMLVMDDGWFGHRESDNSSLGDWFVNEKKLPGGLGALVERVKGYGMRFGIWFEPEMISPDSDLFRSHPDWAIQIKGREMTMSREQYVLDLSRSEVRECVYSQIKRILDSADIAYVKWDCNRQITEAGSLALPSDRQQEVMHRYVLGVYDLMERLVTDYPDLLLENCSGGGGRFDPGMLYYSPQIWCSDDTDALERLKIQYGTSLCYPCSAIGAHVSVCPNHTVGRTTPFSARAHAALAGTFGYELDVTKLSEEDKAAIPGQIALYKKYGQLVRSGDLYRISSIFDDPEYHALMFVAKDKSEALVEYFQVLGRPNRRSRRIKLKGLDPSALYFEEQTPEKTISGAALMNCGINICGLWGDCQSVIFHYIRQNRTKTA